METLKKAGVIYEYFMMHSSRRPAIAKSWKNHGMKLIFGLISMGSGWIEHFEPVNLIADYYGEKHGMYFAYLLHTIAW